MPPLDTGPWLAPVEDGAPAGPNLEFDVEFVALERAAEGKPEQQYGSTVIAAEEPDWKDVAGKAEALLSRTRDLRVLALLAVARLHLDGLAEYADVLGAIRRLLETRWSEVHPQLDPEDDNDPTARANALLGLADPARVVRFLREMPLARSPRLGKYCWRELSAALTGHAEAEQPSETMIAAALRDSDPGWLRTLRNAAATAAAEAGGIVATFEAQAGPATSPDFDTLTKLLDDIARAVERYGAHDEAAAPVEPAVVELADGAGISEPAADAAATAAGSPSRPGASARVTEVTTRAEAVRLLDLVCQYYRRSEPSSPLPLLIERARRLADKDFIEVLRDLAPDGVPQAQFIAGAPDG